MVLATICLLLGIVLFLRSASSGAKLSRYKAELRAKGDKLTYAELAIPVSTSPADIASRDIFATNDFSYPGDTVQLLEYVAAGKVKVAWRGKLHVDPTNDLEKADAPLFLISDWEVFDHQNRDCVRRLEIFRSALKDPAPDNGWTYLDTMQNLTNSWIVRRPYTRIRAAGLTLMDSAVGALHRGDRAAALADLNALIKLAQFYRNDPVLVSSLVRMYIMNWGIESTWQALQMDGWTDEELRELQSGWENVDILTGIKRGLQGERAHNTILADEIRNTSIWKLHEFFGTTPVFLSSSSPKKSLSDYWEEQGAPVLYKLTTMNEDEYLAFSQMTAWVDSIQRLTANEPWLAVNGVLSNRTDEFFRKVRGNRHSYYLSALFVPKFSSVFQHTGEAETLRRLGITAIALKRYELKNGKPPPTLDALVPEFLSAVPLDPMSGKPLCYRLKTSGEYVLYSVGQDGKDDGGDPAPVTSGALPGLWQGRDAVWPTAASDEEVTKEEAEASKKPE